MHEAGLTRRGNAVLAKKNGVKKKQEMAQISKRKEEQLEERRQLPQGQKSTIAVQVVLDVTGQSK